MSGQPPEDLIQQREAIDAALAHERIQIGVEDPEMRARQAAAFEMVRSPMWEHIRDEAARQIPVMLQGYTGNLAHLAMARLGAAAIVEYVEAMARAHQETEVQR